MKVFANLQSIREITEANDINIPDNILTQECKGVSTDTRSLKKGEIFIALEGEIFNGHNFLNQAIDKGAIALITNQSYPYLESIKIPEFKVQDTLQAYQKIAHWWRETLDIPVIGITGSVGKTTTKELISAVLSTQGKVLKTEANYNNEIGVPKTLLQIDETHEYAVIEMAMRGEGEIALLTEIANPNIGLITNVGTAHIGRLGSREAIAKAKCELLAKMDNSGVAILNGDNDLLIQTATKIWKGETITYGLKSGNFRGELVNNHTLKVDNKLYPLPLLGEHNALNYLGAIATGKVLGIDLSVLERGIEVILPKGRAKRHQLGNDIEVLDETYNAGLESMIAALHLLKQAEGQRKIAVLGTMKELGEYATQLHRQVGETVKSLNLDMLLILADEDVTKAMAEGSIGVPTEIFSNQNDLLQHLREVVTKGDRILFKASNSVGLSKVVDEFIKYSNPI
ncbi:UDP-N-acetylmuramoyl-tripeptide--D-alanyl-D-alanine ligase [Geminocystis sp. NIES-3709]|uniref:UDP-N-acetylmuramoyl-tripeptide--D-alanyl-D- alanine ligase n=1 Tax=Geminocystis sp. NIES-3709 TaxID=1617448 RepID=UPI0005FC6AC4|nr:UDP-N-acetylmuramoyl-tripeptide--D-alanyl-D-alanine ligase [Geminocystis sp. NIES-3709]BAQ64703.1 UDP-N-acetylmuramoylalanyl-D-glutamyl-2,6-diaminopimelate--D-alanyl-D-alanine ligase [Geminocystis sp. NIES-3709]